MEIFLVNNIHIVDENTHVALRRLVFQSTNYF